MLKKESMLTQKRLREALDYNEITGVFKWKIKIARWLEVGSVAGHIQDEGYISIGLDGFSYKAHRLAWFYVYGTWPSRLDHKDRCGTHNWVANLRVATQGQNLVNRIVRHGSLPRGVVKNGKGYSARIHVDKKRIQLGTFKTAEEASRVYQEASRQHHGEFSIYV